MRRNEAKQEQISMYDKKTNYKNANKINVFDKNRFSISKMSSIDSWTAQCTCMAQ